MAAAQLAAAPTRSLPAAEVLPPALAAAVRPQHPPWSSALPLLSPPNRRVGNQQIAETNVDEGNDDNRNNAITAHFLVSVSHPVPSLRFQRRQGRLWQLTRFAPASHYDLLSSQTFLAVILTTHDTKGAAKATDLLFFFCFHPAEGRLNRMKGYGQTLYPFSADSLPASFFGDCTMVSSARS